LNVSMCTYVIDVMNRNIKQTAEWQSVLLDGIRHLYFDYSKYEINMTKIKRPQPVIRRLRVGCLFMGCTSRSASGQEYELREMSLSQQCIWPSCCKSWGCTYMAWSALHGSCKRPYCHQRTVWRWIHSHCGSKWLRLDHPCTGLDRLRGFQGVRLVALCFNQLHHVHILSSIKYKTAD
jgi:hypothetical protein